MHLDKEANQLPQLVVENKSEVVSVNEAFVQAGYPLAVGGSVMSSPITSGGEFPKSLSPEDTALVMGVMDQITKSESGTAQEALSEPVDLTFVSIARLAIRGTSIVLDQDK